MNGHDSTPARHPGSDPRLRAARAEVRAAALRASGDAALVFVRGRILTLDPAGTPATALAVRDGRIVAVGPEAVVQGLIGPRTRVIDLRGRTLLPGFGDAHSHPISAGLDLAHCDLHGITGEAAYLDHVRAYAVGHPDEPWIKGGGWSMDDFPGGNPGRASLDAVSPDRPVFLESRDGHTVWVNTRALEIAGMSARTVDPADGVIIREADGTPSGALHEGAIDLVRAHVPPDTDEERIEGLLAAQRTLHAWGITSWQDAIVDPELEAAYRTVAGRGELAARVVGAMWWEPAEGFAQVDAILERRARPTPDGFAATSVKVMVDGVLENFTGAMLEPYLDVHGLPTTNFGLTYLEPAALAEAVVELDGHGIQVHMHAIGDRAVRLGLDAVAAARAVRPDPDARHHIAHIQLIDPADQRRFGELGVVANMQPLWAVHEGQMDRLTIPYLGPSRVEYQYPFRSLERAGARLAGGSDWPVSSANPLLEIDIAVGRVWPDHRGTAPVFLPDERLSLDSALAAFTRGAAFVNHLEDEIGTLEPGKLADLAVLDRDLHDRGSGFPADARVVATFVGGRAVHELPELEG